MEDTKNINDSLNEIKIYKPKAVKLCPSSKKVLKRSSLSSSTSTINSEINMNQNNIEEPKIDLDNITIEEINSDFFIFGLSLEEQECHNELNDILNNASGNESKEEHLEKIEIPKVKRCENPLKKELEGLEQAYFDDLIEEFNNLYNKENKEIKENKEKEE